MHHLCDHGSVHFQKVPSRLSRSGYQVRCISLCSLQLSDFVRRTIRKAVGYLHDAQKPDGGWVGSWGISFTYAAQFALESLSLAGENYSNSSAVQRACKFLLSHQREDGGWGESYKVSQEPILPFRDVVDTLEFFQTCELAKWVEHKNTQIVQTCWATMALMYAGYPDPGPIERAVKLVMSRQLPVRIGFGASSGV